MSGKTPVISVIVPVYKVEAYIRQCIESVLDQTFTDFELILVDDGSPDNCGKICDEYAALDDRVVVIHQENGGVSVARNAALDIARGGYLAFIDSDDYISMNCLEVLYSAIIRTSSDISMCGFFWERENGEVEEKRASCTEEELVLSGKQLSYMRYKNKIDIAPWAKLYRRQLFSKMRFPEGRVYEDQAVVPRIFYMADKAVLLKSCCYYYRIRNDSISNSEFKLNRFDNIIHMNEHIQFLKKVNEKELYKLAINHRDENLAMYTIQAKKNGIRKVPAGCHMSEWRAFIILEKILPYEKFSWHLGKLHPKWVSPYAYLRKIKSILFGKQL